MNGPHCCLQNGPFGVPSLSLKSVKYKTTGMLNGTAAFACTLTGNNGLFLNSPPTSRHREPPADYNFSNRQLEAAVTCYRLKFVNSDQPLIYSPVPVLKRTAASIGVSKRKRNPFTRPIGVTLEAEKSAAVSLTGRASGVR